MNRHNEEESEDSLIGELVVGSGGTALDLALMAWLDAKTNRSGSPKTATAYTTTIASFRRMLQQAGVDLDDDVGAVSLLAQAWAGQGSPSPYPSSKRMPRSTIVSHGHGLRQPGRGVRPSAGHRDAAPTASRHQCVPRGSQLRRLQSPAVLTIVLA